MSYLDASPRPARSAFWRIEVPAWASAPGNPAIIEHLRIDRSEVAVHLTENTAKNPSRVGLTAFGETEDIHRVLREAAIAGLPRPHWCVLPDGVQHGLPAAADAWLPEHRGSQWELYWTEEPLVPQEGEDSVFLLTGDELSGVDDFLAVANPITGARHEIDAYRWYGIRDTDGALAAIIGVKDTVDIDGNSNVYMAGLGTHPDKRRRGFAGALMAGVTKIELRTHRLVTFGMWAFNHEARPLYEKLGYTFAGRQILVTSEPVAVDSIVSD